jgi:hypothetical protein
LRIPWCSTKKPCMDLQHRSPCQSSPFISAEMSISHDEKEYNGVDEVCKGQIQRRQHLDAAGAGSHALKSSLRVGDLGGQCGQGLFEGGRGGVVSLRGHKRKSPSAWGMRKRSWKLGRVVRLTLHGQKDTIMAGRWSAAQAASASERGIFDGATSQPKFGERKERYNQEIETQRS